MSYRLTPRARADLELISDYGLDRWGEARTGQYLSEIGRRIRMIGENPGVGSWRTVRGHRVKVFPTGRHLIVYRISGPDAEIQSVPHQAMRPNSWLP